MKKLLLFLSIVSILTSCDLDNTEHSGYEFEFVFYNPEQPNELIVSPSIEIKDGQKFKNDPNGIYYVQWQRNGDHFTVEFTANDDPFKFLWIEQWKTQHSEDSIPWQVVDPETTYRVESDFSILRDPANGYYRFDVQRLR